MSSQRVVMKVTITSGSRALSKINRYFDKYNGVIFFVKWHINLHSLFNA